MFYFRFPLSLIVDRHGKIDSFKDKTVHLKINVEQ